MLKRGKRGWFGVFTASLYVVLLLRNIQTRLTAVQVALAFLNESAGSTHGNVRVDSIFISASGEWKLGGFDVLSNQKDDAAVLYVRYRMYGCAGLSMIMNISPSQNLGGMLPDASMYSSPEVKKGGYSSLKEYSAHSASILLLSLTLH